ncbi:MAG: hypothetical protein KDC71_15030 [Acidobacteria bacterium]|nr:hypothetical protein [Acidobacteriota bacterium]
MFLPGDHVFYPKGGVFKVETKANKEIMGRSISFYDLVSSDGKTKISIPERNVGRVGVRGLLTPIELQSALETFTPDLKLTKLHHKNRKSKFEVLRQTGDFNDMGIVVATIHSLIQKTKATFEEKRMYDQIRKRLADEIAIVKKLKPESAEKLLHEFLNLSLSRKITISDVSVDDENGQDDVDEEEEDDF